VTTIEDFTAEDDFLGELEALWCALPDELSAVDWVALGVEDPGAIDEHTREALLLLEPARPRAWRAGALPHQREAAEATEACILLMAGRGSGKTYCAAQVLLEWALQEPGDYAIVAPTFGDAVKICTEGPSGFLRAAGYAVRRYDRPAGELYTEDGEVRAFNRNEYVIYLANGSRIVLASADAPDRIRGWNLTGAWIDELGSFRDLTVWDEGLEFAIRIGRARRIVSTTPKRGHRLLKELETRAKIGDGTVRLIRASTRDNAANLSEEFLQRVEQRYLGTTLGAQELDGILLDDVEGAMVTTTLVAATRVSVGDVPEELWRIAVGVDPATTSKAGSDHTGIIVMGIGPAPSGWQPPAGKVVLAGLAHLYTLADYTIKASPEAWARRVLEVADEWDADVIAAESNNGGDLVETTVRLVAEAEDRPMPYFHAVHAAKGKKARAEPVAGAWEQHRIHLLKEAPGGTAELEEQWTGYVPTEAKESPDRLDASVWAAVELMPELATSGATLVKLLSAAG
jgi:phage terminase large subunit-like protein